MVADDLTPSETVHLGRQGVRGFALEGGGRTSHTTIIARSLNVPLVCGLEGLTARLTDDEPVIVDGGEGVGRPPPDPPPCSTTTATAAPSSSSTRPRCSPPASSPPAPATASQVSLMANIDLTEELGDGARFGAAGIGLYRSEFLYIERSPAMPTEQDHLAVYRRVVEAAAPYPAIIRTYDLGGRKLAREVMHTEEENPVLGLRGIRLTLARPEVFRTQLRALFRAGDLRRPVGAAADDLDPRRGAPLPRLRRRRHRRAGERRRCRSSATTSSA